MLNAFHNKLGLVIGKFLPFHRGHEYLIRFAQKFCDEVHVQVCLGPYDPISVDERAKWIKETFGDGIVVLKNIDILPQEPNEDPENFWEKWRNSLNKYCEFASNKKYDYVFASEQYGYQLANELEAEYIPADPTRQIVPISGTKIKENLWENWNYLNNVVQRELSIPVIVVGAESCGKTTLCQKLAKHYKTCWLPEYARVWLEDREAKMEFTEQDMITFWLGQKAEIDNGKNFARRLYFVDTDPIITEIYNEIYFNNKMPLTYYPPKNAHYLVLEPTVPWVADDQRNLKHMRDHFQDMLIQKLTKRNVSYTIISNCNYNKRYEEAIQKCNKLLSF